MGCLSGLHRSAGGAEEDRKVNGARAPSAGRCRKSTGTLRRRTRAVNRIIRARVEMSHHASGPNFGFPLGDARLDMTDLYAFPKPGQPDRSVLILNVHPSYAVNPLGPTTKEPFARGAHEPLACATKATSSSREHPCQSIGRRWLRKQETTVLSLVGAAIPSFSTQMACSTTCSSLATISSRTRMCAASYLNCPTRLLVASRWDSGVAR